MKEIKVGQKWESKKYFPTISKGEICTISQLNDEYCYLKEGNCYFPLNKFYEFFRLVEEVEQKNKVVEYWECTSSSLKYFTEGRIYEVQIINDKTVSLLDDDNDRYSFEKNVFSKHFKLVEEQEEIKLNDEVYIIHNNIICKTTVEKITTVETSEKTQIKYTVGNGIIRNKVYRSVNEIEIYNL